MCVCMSVCVCVGVCVGGGMYVHVCVCQLFQTVITIGIGV